MKGFIILLATFCSLQIANAKEVVLNTRNVCTLDQQVTARSMRALKLCLVDKVTQRRGRDYPIYLYLNSPGGSIYHGLRFISFAKTIKNLHTITEYSASMAAAIAQSLPGDRYVTDNGLFMFHRAKGSIGGQFEDGEMESRLKLWKQIVRKMEKAQADRIGITLKEYKQKRINEWWVYAEDNLTQNTADAMVSVKCSSALIREKTKVVRHTFFGSFEEEVSMCPLVN